MRVLTRRNDDATGFSLIELLIVVAIISIIAAIAVPRLLRARMTANESAAIATVKTVATAELMFAESCGSGGFATSLPQMAAAPGGGQPFLQPDLTGGMTVTRTGYVIGVGSAAAGLAGPNDCMGVATETAYYITAVPTSFGTTGTRSFASTGVPIIWQVNAAAAPAEPFGAPAQPVQ